MEKEVNRTQAVQVNMLGEFSMSYAGREIAGGAGKSVTQFDLLMQLILHQRKEGVYREELEETLFLNREVNNARHAVQSVIYNAKKRLRECGLPDIVYITPQDDRFFWTDEIPVIEDAELFEDIYRQAEEAKTSARRKELYLQAVHLYRGAFLKSDESPAWVLKERQRYQAMFRECVKKALDLIRRRGEFEEMEQLGLYAAEADPLAEWESLTMEALTALGRYDECWKLYEDTADLYRKEAGIKPKMKMPEMANGTGYAVLDEILEDLHGEETGSAGGWFCSYPVFMGFCHVCERNGYPVFLMLCTIVDSKGSPMREGGQLDELSARLKEAIGISLQSTDVYCRYGSGQYLLLLSGDCEAVRKKIDENFLTVRQRTGVRYSIEKLNKEKSGS